MGNRQPGSANGSDTQILTQPVKFSKGVEKPSFQDVKDWSDSFDRLMNSKVGRQLFGEFLKKEFADENILFWQACEDLKREKDADKINEKARIIYEDFVSMLSPKEVSLDSRIRERINDNMLRPTVNTFDEAQSHVYMLMQKDCYPRFLKSKFYRDLLASYAECEDL